MERFAASQGTGAGCRTAVAQGCAHAPMGAHRVHLWVCVVRRRGQRRKNILRLSDCGKFSFFLQPESACTLKVLFKAICGQCRMFVEK